MNAQTSPHRKHLLMIGGGTAGHVFPLIALHPFLQKHQWHYAIITDPRGQPQLQNHFPPHHIRTIRIHGWYRKKWWKNLDLTYLIPWAFWRATFWLERWKPTIIFATGGYVQVPVLWAARHLRTIPLILYEPNAIPGLATRLFLRQATRICTFLPSDQLPKDKTIQTGVPLRPTFLKEIQYTPQQARQQLNLPQNQPILTILGGSLGAQFFNEFLAQTLKHWIQQGVFIIWQTGKQPIPQHARHYHNHPQIRMAPFFDHIGLILRASTLAVVRAGATTLAEILASGTPAIAVPSPHVADNHQEANARTLAEQGAIHLVRQQEGFQSLRKTIEHLLQNPHKRQQLANKAKQLAITDSAHRLFQTLQQYANLHT